jgi:outer membrane protein OmpA-like peptidoglycan-associated protein
MRFTRILLISLMLVLTAIVVSAQTGQSVPATQSTPAMPTDQATQPASADQTAPASQTGIPGQETAANPEDVPLKIFKPDVVIFGQPQADFDQHMQPVLFDLDVYDHPVNEDAINADVQYLQDHPSVKFWLDGYADVRGDILYNMTLSQRRVNTVREALLQKGIPEDRILVDVGWGKLYPVCLDMTEECLQKNRRVHFQYVP